MKTTSTTDGGVPVRESEMRHYRNDSVGLASRTATRRGRSDDETSSFRHRRRDDDTNANSRVATTAMAEETKRRPHRNMRPSSEHTSLSIDIGDATTTSAKLGVPKDREDAQHVTKSAHEKKHHHHHHKKKKKHHHHHHHHNKKHEGLDEQPVMQTVAGSKVKHLSPPSQNAAAAVARNEVGRGTNMHRSMTQPPQGNELPATALSSSRRQGEEKGPEFYPLSTEEQGTNYSAPTAAATKDSGSAHPERTSRPKKTKHASANKSKVHSPNLTWDSSNKPALHASTAKSKGKTLEVLYHQSDSDSIGHPSSRPSTPEKKHPEYCPSTYTDWERSDAASANATTRLANEKYPISAFHLEKHPEIYPFAEAERRARQTDASNTFTDKKLKAPASPLQPEDLDIAPLPTPALGLMTDAPVNEMDLEAGVVEISYEEHGDLHRIPPQPIEPGAVAVHGPDATNDDGSIAEFTTTASSVNLSCPEEESATETPISATLVNTEEEHQKWKEEMKNDAPLAEVVNCCGCNAAESRRWGIAGIIVILGAVIICVLAGLLTREKPPEPPKPRTYDPSLVSLLSTVSLDGNKTFLNESTPQNDALYWLSENENLHSYSNETKIQQYVLATLYYSNNGGGWNNNSGWLMDSNECNWEDVICSGNNSIKELNLEGNNLAGTVPNELALLSGSIDVLLLSSNGLMGTIPPEIGKLTGLTELNLESNGLAGSIPPEIGQMTKLKYLRLGGNTLTGSIPTEIGQLNQLVFLELHENDFMDTIPTEIGNLTELSLFSLRHNNLMGTIPSNIGQLKRLGVLHLQHNHLTGTIPTEIGKLTGLLSLSVLNNNLTGNIPVEIELLTKLYDLWLETNTLTGTIPTEIGQWNHQLETLSLGANKLTGTIPTEIGRLTGLHYLFLDSSGLAGTFPTEIGQMNKLAYLYLNNNTLTGTIPTEIGQLTELDVLWLGNNTLTGTIPTEIGRLTELNIGVALSKNSLTGTIPTEIGKLTKLDVLRLNNNNLTGAIPSELEQFSELTSLTSYNNSLTGNFTCPDFIEECLLSCSDANDTSCRSL